MFQVCEETYNGMHNTTSLTGRKFGFNNAGQSIRAVETPPERCLAAGWNHHSVIQTLLEDLRIVSGFLWVIKHVKSKAFERILSDIRDMIANHHVASYDTINCRLDLFKHEFEVI